MIHGAAAIMRIDEIPEETNTQQTKCYVSGDLAKTFISYFV
jgi:hypothetical protein